MMRAVIVEDEALAAEKLERYIKKYDKNILIVAFLASIEEAVDWFKSKDSYDVVFIDIQLTDGLSFEIFNRVTIAKPIIFTTAFDEYAVDAFKVNSIDYILKPITFTDVSTALNKLKSMKSLFMHNKNLVQAGIDFKKNKKKDRFVVRLGNHLHSIKVESISLFFAEGRTVYLVTNEGKKFILDYNLENLSKVLDANLFFRVNRTFIININAIKEVLVFSNSRLKLSINYSLEKEIIVSRDKVTAFKNWLEGI